MNHNHYRDILREVLKERQKINTSYSLRAFAKSLGLSNSQLSRILNEKQGLSIKKAKCIAEKLGFNKHEDQIFCLMVQSKDARSKKERDKALEKLQEINNKSLKSSSKELPLEDYELLREWYNIAILELMDTEGFSSNPSWISKELGITSFLVKESIKKLLNLGVVENQSGQLKKTQRILKISQSIPSDLMKNYYDQLLSRAKESIRLQSMEERHLSSVTISLDEDDIQVLSGEIDKFRSHFNTMAESLAYKKGKKRKAVYSLTTQFFKINTGSNL